MLQRLYSALRAKFVVLAGLAGLSAVLGLVLVPTTDAGAVSCRVFTPTTDWYEAGQVASKQYTVPSTPASYCQDINVRNVKNMDPAMSANHPDKYCAVFRVAMYPSDKTKPIYYSQPKRACSKDPSSSSSTNGPVIPIATTVLNGTKYRVLYQITKLETGINYQIVD